MNQISEAALLAFYRANAADIIARMRRPSVPTRNEAATIVARCETNRRLRDEALEAIRVAEARAALDKAIRAYAPTGKPRALRR